MCFSQGHRLRSCPGFTDFALLCGGHLDGSSPHLSQARRPDHFPGPERSNRAFDAFVASACGRLLSDAKVINALVVELLNTLFTSLATWLTELRCFWPCVVAMRTGKKRSHRDARSGEVGGGRLLRLKPWQDRENHRSYSEHANHLLVLAPKDASSATGGGHG